MAKVNMSDTFEQMERMYRPQRYFYDLTRRYYLLGRDELLEEMSVSNGENVLEVGCGTARNLIILARRFGDSRFFGIDASAAMLSVARRRINGFGLSNIFVRSALAGDLDHRRAFDLDRHFDKIFFSYSISMIPEWRAAIDNALANLKPGGTLYIVDFYDQAELPRVFRRALKWWLSRFHVHYRPEFAEYLEELRSDGKGNFSIEPLFRRYSYIAKFEKIIGCRSGTSDN